MEDNLKVEVYDIETYKAMFVLCAYIPSEDRKVQYEISRRKNELSGLVKYLLDGKRDYMVGFNNVRFDMQVLQYILDSYELWENLSGSEIVILIYEFAQDVIRDQDYDKFPYREAYLDVPQLDLRLVNHFDNLNRMVSLKFAFEFSLDGDIEELPFDFRSEHLSDEEMDQVIDYCWVDVNATHTGYKLARGWTDHPDYKGKDKIQLRLDLIKEYNLPHTAINWNDVKIGAELNKLNYLKMSGLDDKELWSKVKNRKTKTGFRFRECFPEYIEFKTKEFQEFFKEISSVQVNLNVKQEFPFMYKGVKFMFAKGGGHSQEGAREVIPNNNQMLIDCDVSSMYPNIIRKRELYPAHLGKIWNTAYVSNIPKRLEAKRLYKETKEKKYDNFQECFKLVLNGCFGRLIDRHDYQYDPFCGMCVTIGGQVDIFMLMEQLAINDWCQIISMNTDGLTVMIEKEKIQEYWQICKQWEKQVGNDTLGQLEYVEYEKLVQTSVNDYLAVKRADWREQDSKLIEVLIDKPITERLKKKGDFLTSYEVHKNKSCSIVPIALERYFIQGIPVEKTISEHPDIFAYCIAKKASKDYFYRQIDRTTGKITNHNKLVRYYCSTEGEKLYKIKHEHSDKKGKKVSQCEADSEHQVMFNRPFIVPMKEYKIDETYYLNRCYKLIDAIQPEYKRNRKIKESGAMLLFN